MADRNLPRSFAQTLEVLEMDEMSPPLGEYIACTFPPRQDWLASAKARLDRIFASDSSIDTTPASRERELGLIDPRTPQDKLENKNKWDAVVNNVWGGRSETVAQYLKDTPDKAEGIDPTEASQEIAITARHLGALTAPVVKANDGRVDKEELTAKIYKVAATNAEGAVTDTNAITAFDAKQESIAVKDTQQEVRAEQSPTMLTEAEQQELLKLQQLAIATNFENNYVLTEWRTAMMTIYQQREQNGTLNSEITQELVSQVGAISARIERNIETIRTMTMQPA